jgi:sirohydrochlorin cobaltochelatase
MGGSAAMTEIGVALCGHGSRNARAAAEFLDLAGRAAERLTGFDVEPGFMELAEPRLEAAVDALYARGRRRILVAPAMLFAAGHVKTDLPVLLRELEAGRPGLTLELGRPFGCDAAMVRAAAARAGEGLAEAGRDLPAAETLLLLIGRGGSDPDANADAAKMMRLVWETAGFGWGEIGYCDVTFPHAEAAMDRAARLGYARVLVLPYLLFTGVLDRRIRGWAAAAGARHPGTEYVVAPYLGIHTEIVALYAERVLEMLRGEAVMNCRLCRYRSALPGFAAQVGLPQAEGAAKPPYPHAGHPQGPKRAKG